MDSAGYVDWVWDWRRRKYVIACVSRSRYHSIGQILVWNSEFGCSFLTISGLAESSSYDGGGYSLVNGGLSEARRLGGQCIKFHLLGDKVREFLDGWSKIDVTMCISLGLEL